MSEYQYYEFTAIDRPLTGEEMSSREAFERVLKGCMARHGKRTALVRRLVQAGLWKK